MEELVEKAKYGDKDAYSELIINVRKDLYLTAKKKINDEHDIEDIIQDTTIIGYIKIKQLRDNKFFKAWMMKILNNECKKFYRDRQREEEINEKYLNDRERIEEDIDDKIDFDNMIKDLKDTDKEVMKLYYEDNLSSEQISRRLGINDNTIKSKLSRSKKKIGMNYKKVLMTILICFFVTTGAVFGKDIINYLKDIFNLSIIDQNNDGILSAIENKEWIQNTEMEYIELSEGYKIRIDYLLIDDINMYMVFDLQCEEENTEYNRMSIANLTVHDENGNIICNAKDIMADSVVKLRGWKSIKTNSNKNIRELCYLIADGYPNMERIDITFGDVTLYNDKYSNKEKKVINKNERNISINIDEKFINRNVVEYIQEEKDDKYNIQKAIITDTGFYAIIETSESKIDFVLENNKKKYQCNYRYLDIDDDNEIYYHLISANIDLKNSGTKLILKTEDKNIELKSENGH